MERGEGEAYFGYGEGVIDPTTTRGGGGEERKSPRPINKEPKKRKRGAAPSETGMKRVGDRRKKGSSWASQLPV